MRGGERRKREFRGRWRREEMKGEGRGEILYGGERDGRGGGGDVIYKIWIPRVSLPYLHQKCIFIR